MGPTVLIVTTIIVDYVGFTPLMFLIAMIYKTIIEIGFLGICRQVISLIDRQVIKK
jgi:hypothetical protein